MDSLGLHIITVGADKVELALTEKMLEVVKPLSAKTFAALDELKPEEFGTDAYTLIRLFGAANTQALTWLGAKGRVATEAAIIGAVDAIIAEPGQPLRAVSVLPHAFVSAIASSKITFDTSSAAFIVGANAETKPIAASLARMGFKRLLVVDTDDRKTEMLVQYLQRRLLGIKISGIPRRTLTQVPNESTMAVNLVRSTEMSILEDMSYLNFLKKNGVFIDWTGATFELGFDAEIRDAGATIFDSNGIRAWREAWMFAAIPGLLESTRLKPDVLALTILEAWKPLAVGLVR